MTTVSLLHRQVSAPEKSKTSYEGMWVPCAFESAQSEFILLHTAYSTVRINTPTTSRKYKRQRADLRHWVLSSLFNRLTVSISPTFFRTAMPSTANSVDNVPSYGRRQSAAGNTLTLTQALTCHDFQAQGSAKAYQAATIRPRGG